MRLVEIGESQNQADKRIDLETHTPVMAVVADHEIETVVIVDMAEAIIMVVTQPLMDDVVGEPNPLGMDVMMAIGLHHMPTPSFVRAGMMTMRADDMGLVEVLVHMPMGMSVTLTVRPTGTGETDDAGEH